MLAFVGLVVLRFIAFDGVRFLAALNAQTRLAVPPRVRDRVRGMVLPQATRWRSWRRSVVVFQILIVVPSIGRPQEISAAARDAPRLRVLSANVRYSNPDARPVWRAS